MLRLALAALSLTLPLSLPFASIARADFTGSPEATLRGVDAFGGFGASVAIDGTGTRAVVGTRTSSGIDVDRIAIFVRAGATWAEEAVFTAPSTGLGQAVAISPDGTLVLGGAATEGSVRVYTRTGTTWAEGTAIRVTGTIGLGQAISIDAAGTRAVLGTRGSNQAIVVVRSGGAWSVEATLVPVEASMFFGLVVAISPDGTRIAVGAPYETADGVEFAGVVRIYSRSGSVWSLEATLLRPAPRRGEFFGGGLVLDEHAETLVIGGSYETRVVRRTGTSWSEGTVLSGGSLTAGITPDGETLVVGYASDPMASVRHYEWSGTAWVRQDAITGPVRVVGAGWGTAVALAADGSRLIVGEPGSASSGSFAYVYTDVGDACSDGTTCTTGHCVDGVCCESACGGGAADCQSCLGSITGLADGRCAPLPFAVARMTVCRPSAGDCDPEEICSSSNRECPADRLGTFGTPCRYPRTGCDAMETCTGSSPTCPADRAVAADTVCRLATSMCDVAERCDGTSFDCPMNGYAMAGTTCRASSEACDPAEVCDGASASCPGDVTTCVLDAGMPDAGEPDAGSDAGEVDAGELDAGVDAGIAMIDAGVDAGRDAGMTIDTGTVLDAAPARPDASGDAGVDAGAPVISEGCACRAGHHERPMWPLVLLGLVVLRRRSRV